MEDDNVWILAIFQKCNSTLAAMWVKVEGWNPTKNDISVKVAGKDNAISFPEPVKAPMIIAVDPTTNWMTERTPAPEAWF